VRLAPLVAGVILLTLLAPAAYAQSATDTLAPPPAEDAGADAAPTPTPSHSSTSASPFSSFQPLTQDQANGLFDGFLIHGFEATTGGVRNGLQRLVDDANLVTNTAATWTYQQPTVVALQLAVQTGSNGALAVLIFWLGLNVLLRPHLGGTYLEAHEMVPRLVLGAGLANSAAHWTALAIDLNNAACSHLLAASSGSLTDLFARAPTLDRSWLIALLLVAFLIVWIWLYIKMAARMAMLMVLLMLAPAAQLCWVLPQTRGLADRWHSRFWTTLYAQVVVTAALKLAWGFSSAAGDNPIALLITICLLFLAANSPELLAGGVSRVGLVESALLLARTTALGHVAGSAAAGAMAALVRPGR